VNGVVTVTVTENDYHVARGLIASRPVYRRSHRGEAANEVGCLGEAVVLRVLSEAYGIPVEPVFDTTHDLELPDGSTVEVKTKDRTVAPRPEYDCSVPDYVADHQHADFYVFVSLQRPKGVDDGLERFHTAHIVGVGSPHLLARRGRVMEAGTTDTNGTTFWTTCRNVAIADLVPLTDATYLWCTAPA
jgi:hypothetical protein